MRRKVSIGTLTYTDRIPNTVYWYLVFFYLLLLFFRLKTRINASFSSHIYVYIYFFAAPRSPSRHLFVDDIYDPINITTPRFPDFICRQTYAVIIVYDSLNPINFNNITSSYDTILRVGGTCTKKTEPSM